MRIKTTEKTLLTLAEVTKTLGLNSNADTLKLAISIALNRYSCKEELKVHEFDESGFEIDTHILFGDELEYYYEIIKFFNNKTVANPSCNVSKHDICILIENGYIELYKYFQLAKGDVIKFTKYVMELI